MTLIYNRIKCRNIERGSNKVFIKLCAKIAHMLYEKITKAKNYLTNVMQCIFPFANCMCRVTL